MTMLSRLARLLPALAVVLAAGTAIAGGQLYDCGDLASRAKLSDYNARVYQGDAGWFFRDNDLDQLYLMSPRAITFLTRLRDGLAARGITLMLMPVPPKAVMGADHARAAVAGQPVIYDPDRARTSFLAMIEDLRSHGIATIDILGFMPHATDTFPGEDYFPQDIHWRPRFAKISAQAAADELARDLGPSIIGTQDYATTVLADQPHQSANNSILNQLCKSRIPGERLDVYTTTAKDQSVDSFLGGSGDGGSTGAAVDIIGDSFTDEANKYNFSGFLREALKNDVATYSLTGGGIDSALFKWVYQGPAAVAGAKALVWQLAYPERIEAAAPELERQVIPAITGDCGKAALATAKYTADPTKDFTLTLDPAVKARGDSYYLTASLSDPTATPFALTYHYRDGAEEIAPIVRPERVPQASQWFAELPADSGELGAVTFSNLSPAPESGTISLCRYPETVRPTTTPLASN